MKAGVATVPPGLAPRVKAGWGILMPAAVQRAARGAACLALAWLGCLDGLGCLGWWRACAGAGADYAHGHAVTVEQVEEVVPVYSKLKQELKDKLGQQGQGSGVAVAEGGGGVGGVSST